MTFEKRLKFLVEIFSKRYKSDFLKEEEIWIIKKYLAVSGFFNK